MNIKRLFEKFISTRTYLLFVPFFVFISCEKSNIKNHYTGNFNFITINTDSSYSGGPHFICCDTISTSGSIEYAADNILLIKVGGEQYAVNVDSDGNLTLYSTESYYPHGSDDLIGRFENYDKLSFVYNTSYSFMGHSSSSKRSVVGARQ